MGNHDTEYLFVDVSQSGLNTFFANCNSHSNVFAFFLCMYYFKLWQNFCSSHFSIEIAENIVDTLLISSSNIAGLLCPLMDPVMDLLFQLHCPSALSLHKMPFSLLRVFILISTAPSETCWCPVDLTAPWPWSLMVQSQRRLKEQMAETSI